MRWIMIIVGLALVWPYIQYPVTTYYASVICTTQGGHWYPAVPSLQDASCEKGR
jgi:hypothetical protein